MPASVVVLDELPLTGVGKVDRAALPAPRFDTDAETLTAPATELERLVVGVFEDVLGVSPIGIDTHFFDVGGNSLTATRVIARVNALLGTDIGVRGLFESPTVRQLSRLAESVGRGENPRPPLTRRSRPDPLPVSLAQKRMWFLNQFDVTSPRLQRSPGSAPRRRSGLRRIAGRGSGRTGGAPRELADEVPPRSTDSRFSR